MFSVNIFRVIEGDFDSRLNTTLHKGNMPAQIGDHFFPLITIYPETQNLSFY